MWFGPSVESEANYMSWWNFSSDFFERALQVIGFREFHVTTHLQRYLRPPQDLGNYTVIARR